MPKRYTLTECYDLLEVDPKTFRGWLQKAGMEAQVSKADPRVKYLTEEQVRSLAGAHERDLERNLERAKRRPEMIAPNAYKMVKDQVDALERQAATLEQRQAGVYEELLGTITEAEARQQQVSEGLFATVTGVVEEMRRSVDLQHQQHESLLELLNQQGGLVEQLRAEQAAQREDVRIVHGQIEAAEARQAHRVKELQQAVTQELHRSVDELHRWAEKLLEQRVREVYDALEALNKEVAADLVSMQEHVDQAGARMDKLATRIEAVQITALGSERRADVQDQAIADLRAQLQEEARAREALAEQVAALQGEKKAPEKQPRK
jgi:hypothetical protein